MGALKRRRVCRFQLTQAKAGEIQAAFQLCHLRPAAVIACQIQKRIVMFYNDQEGVPFGDPEFEWRTPLSVAVSDDDAATWRRLPDIENNEHNYCYLSACLQGKGRAFLLSRR